jgi:hypothetical protein
MPARIAITRIAGDQELSDQEVFDILSRQMVVKRGVVGGCQLEISVKATEAQVDKAMSVLMQRVGDQEIARIRQGLPI